MCKVLEGGSYDPSAFASRNVVLLVFWRGWPLAADLSARYSPCRYILYRAKTRQCLIRIRAAAQQGYPSEPRCGATPSGASLAACLASPARATHAATSQGSAAQAQRRNRHQIGEHTSALQSLLRNSYAVFC